MNQIRNAIQTVRQTYRKIPTISDTRKFAVITLKVEQDGFSLEKCIQKMQRELQTVYTLIRLLLTDCSRSSLIWVCTVCPDLSVRKLRIITADVCDNAYVFNNQ